MKLSQMDNAFKLNTQLARYRALSRVIVYK